MDNHLFHKMREIFPGSGGFRFQWSNIKLWGFHSLNFTEKLSGFSILAVYISRWFRRPHRFLKAKVYYTYTWVMLTDVHKRWTSGQRVVFDRKLTAAPYKNLAHKPFVL